MNPVTVGPVVPTPGNHKNLIVGPHHSVNSSAQRIPVGADACRQTQIIMHKQGELVKSIDVVCACGEKTTIELIYP